MNGFLCVLKPPGMTSSDVVVRVRRKLGRGVKVGHAGTLDPEASGVLPLMIGRAARLFDYLVEKEKTYVAQLKPGYATDTQDAHGAIIAGEGAHATRAQLEAVLPRFIGEIAQIPPMYSALKRDGQKLCDLARQGIDVKVEPRPTQVYAIQVLHENADGSFMLQIRCGRGTYIRTLCHDIGEALGCGGMLTALRRTETLGFTTADCHTLEELKQASEEGRFEELLMPVDAAFRQYKSIFLSPKQSKMFLDGIRLDTNRIKIPAEGDTVRVYGDGRFLALAHIERSIAELQIIKLFYTKENPNC